MYISSVIILMLIPINRSSWTQNNKIINRQLTSSLGNWWTSICVRVYSGKMFRFYLRASRCSVGCASTPTYYIYTHFLPGHTNKTLLSIMPRGMFRVSTGTPWPLSRVCTGLLVNIVRWFSHRFPITKLILLICGCMCAGTPGHIPRHTGQTSPNNNILTRLYSP